MALAEQNAVEQTPSITSVAAWVAGITKVSALTNSAILDPGNTPRRRTRPCAGSYCRFDAIDIRNKTERSEVLDEMVTAEKASEEVLHLIDCVIEEKHNV